MVKETFDTAVHQALAKWPNVPACFGWLSLDRRGRWCIQGDMITHAGAIAFLGRNYAQDELGRWFVQNGPQRAYCDLEYTPMIYHLRSKELIYTHTNKRAAALRQLVLDDCGNLLLETELGIGLLVDRDLGAFYDELELAPPATTDADDPRQTAATVDDLFERVVASINPQSKHVKTPHPIPSIIWCGQRIDVRAAPACDIAAIFDFEPSPSATSP